MDEAIIPKGISKFEKTKKGNYYTFEHIIKYLSAIRLKKSGQPIKQISILINKLSISELESYAFAEKSDFEKIFNNVDLSLPDGRPLTWISYLCGNGLKQRISGPDLMIYLLNRCNKNKLKVYFYGSSQKVLNSITNRLNNEYKNIEFSVDSPPYRLLTEEENIIKVKNINSFEPNIIFVGLGHPKQEEWIFKNRNKINSVMIGVGAAFDFYSGHTRRAPKWMRIIGLEWLYRLIQNPRRLFKRYLISNTFFIFFGIIQVFKHYVKKFFR